METRRYALMRDGKGWAFDGPHEVSQTYLSKEAAFEGVIAAIRRDLVQGDAIELQIIQGAEPSQNEPQRRRSQFSVSLC